MYLTISHDRAQHHNKTVKPLKKRVEARDMAVIGNDVNEAWNRKFVLR